jgi:N-acyl amino acid synthase of PEP-CTERM/exosortase system
VNDSGVSKKYHDKDKQKEDEPSKDEPSSEQQMEPSMLQTAAARSSLGVNFKTRFEVVPALNDALKDEVYRLRHSVYCEDLHWEPARPDGREIDAYDAQSILLIMRHVGTGEYVGCARLVRPSVEDPSAPLPFERSSQGSLDPAIFDFASVPREQVAEVSRLAVIAKYRRRHGEAARPTPASGHAFGTEHMPRFPYILIGLYLGVVAIARQQGIETLFVLTEPRLAHHFRRLGVEIRQIGKPVEHRGMRIPSVMSVSDIIIGLNPYVRPIYDEIVEAVKGAYRSY